MTQTAEGTARVPVKFSRPPIVEVACGVLFSSARPILTGHVGSFWERMKSEFPRIQDAAPLASVLEVPGQLSGVNFQFSDLPPLRRVWLLDADGRNLIQMQEDRFLFNWKKASDDDCYPDYGAVYAKFEYYLSEFLAFAQEVGIGAVTTRQFELVYVNHISSANGLDLVGPSALMVDHVREASEDRFLPNPEGFNWTTVYPMPDGIGRLYVAAQTAVNQPNQEKLVRLDITARGIGTDTSPSGRKQWFDIAHDWITHGFVDVTSKTLHEPDAWGRTA